MTIKNDYKNYSFSIKKICLNDAVKYYILM